MTKSMFLLYESATGYALFERLESEVVNTEDIAWQKSLNDLSKFGKIVKMTGFAPFLSAEDSLKNINDISEGLLSDFLQDFLSTYMPSSGAELGVADPSLGSSIQTTTKIPCVSNTVVKELLRGVRVHFDSFISALEDGDVVKAQLGLGHAFSRARVKFNVNRVDNMIIQSITLLDVLDKDLNQFSMRVKEWYSWHFPELVKLAADNAIFARLVLFVQDKGSLTDESLEGLEEIVGDASLAQSILTAARTSMGQDISEIDLANITRFAERVSSLAEYRTNLHVYLQEKMNTCAPNLAALIGEFVGARLISHAGSLTSLAKYPASTVQILGAEKALFRALKTRGNTPKYGIIFNSAFISRAGAKNKGRISRVLANKVSIASRLDAFSDVPTAKFGEMLRSQVEERLEFYASGTAPRRNKEVMKEVIAELESEGLYTSIGVKSSSDKKDKKEKKKRSRESDDDDEDEEPVAKKKKKSKDKDKKKSKKESKSKDKDKKKSKKKSKSKKE